MYFFFIRLIMSEYMETVVKLLPSPPPPPVLRSRSVFGRLWGYGSGSCSGSWFKVAFINCFQMFYLSKQPLNKIKRKLNNVAKFKLFLQFFCMDGAGTDLSSWISSGSTKKNTGYDRYQLCNTGTPKMLVTPN